MASSGGFSGFRELQCVALQRIVSLPEFDGKTLLAEELGIPPYIDVKDSQKAPFVSYIYDSIIFAAEKGFPWHHISIVVKVAHEYLKRILVEKHQISDAIKDFKDVSMLLEPLSDKHKKQYTDYIFETVLCHYKLYKYVFSHSRDILHPTICQDVHVPETPVPLKDGKSVRVWEYEEQLNKVIERESEEKSDLKKKLQSVKAESNDYQISEAVTDAPVPYSKSTLTGLIKDALKSYMIIKENELKTKVEVTAKDLEYKLEKTALPRPLELGSPPRYKTKNANHRSTIEISDKRERSSKSRGSRSGRASAASSTSKI